MGDVTKPAKAERHEDFSTAVGKAATAVCALTESAAQSAYLVAISDPSSTAAVPSLVDSSQFARAQQAIRQACEQLLDPSSVQSQVLSSATVIAKHTSALCNACKVAFPVRQRIPWPNESLRKEYQGTAADQSIRRRRLLLGLFPQPGFSFF